MKQQTTKEGRVKTLLRHGLLAAGVAAALIVAGSAQAQTTIRFMGWVGLFDFQKPGWERIVGEFQRANPDIKIEYVGTQFEDTLRQITAATLANRAPDVLQMTVAWVPQLVEQGALEPLAPLVGQEDLGRFWKRGIEDLSVNGQVYALPWIPSPHLLAYNRNLLREAGANPDQPPKTWAELTEAVNKVCALPAKPGGRTYGIALRTARDAGSTMLTPLVVWGFGGEVANAEGQPDMNNAGAQRAFEWYRDLVRRGCSPEAANIQETRTLFAQGRAAFIIDGPYIRGLIQTMSQDRIKFAADGDAWVAPAPLDPAGKSRQFGAGNILGISPQSANKAAAAKFVRFVTGNPATVNYFYETSGQITTGRLDILRDGPQGRDPYLRIFIEALDSMTTLPMRNPRYNAMLDAMAPSLQRVIQGAEAQPELRRLTDEMRRIAR
jgi:multiple sugar transport system substrate-binding protein